MKINKRALSGWAAPAMLMFLAAGCASQGSLYRVKPGDVADVRFTCRLRTGEVVAATDRAVGMDASIPKSAVFIARGGNDALPVTAPDPARPKPKRDKEMAFEWEVVDRLDSTVLGMRQGEKRTVEITAEELTDRGKEDYLVRVARVRKRPKKMTMPAGDYKFRAGKEPEKGQPFTIDPAFHGVVEAVEGGEVTIAFSARPGDAVETPFGPGVIRETEEEYEVDIDARKGALVRSGPVVGRITDVEGEFITIDYRHPFGGEALICDLTVENITENKTGKGGTGE